jgi:SAM-dependent methyltransferase
MQGDACALPSAAQFASSAGVPGGGRFSVIHGANLLCRLPDPMLFLQALPGLLVPGGIVVLVSPYSWLKQYTPRSNWLGACGIEGAPCRCVSLWCRWDVVFLCRPIH